MGCSSETDADAPEKDEIMTQLWYMFHIRGISPSLYWKHLKLSNSRKSARPSILKTVPPPADWDLHIGCVAISNYMFRNGTIGTPVILCKAEEAFPIKHGPPLRAYFELEIFAAPIQ